MEIFENVEFNIPIYTEERSTLTHSKWNKVFHEKLIADQLANKFPTFFFGARKIVNSIHKNPPMNSVLNYSSYVKIKMTVIIRVKLVPAIRTNRHIFMQIWMVVIPTEDINFVALVSLSLIISVQ
jgi:hypothetical protein